MTGAINNKKLTTKDLPECSCDKERVKIILNYEGIPGIIKLFKECECFYTKL